MGAADRIRIVANRMSHRLRYAPIVTLMAHSRCNCQCAMCDIWKDNRRAEEITARDIDRMLPDLRRLRTRWVVLSGGEALLHSDLWSVCRALAPIRPRITLLSTGLLVARYASECEQFFSDIIVSLDGPEQVHDRIRNVPGAFSKIGQAVAAMRAIDPNYPIHARSVVQRLNYQSIGSTVAAARDLGLSSISFLPVDTTSDAFNHTGGWIASDVERVGLSSDDVRSFREHVENLVRDEARSFAEGFILESPAKLFRMADYFAAQVGERSFPPVYCNAPWVSTVIEANGDVRPCFFHDVLGNIHSNTLLEVLNGDSAITFRKALDVAEDDTCQRCVCSLKH